MGQLPTEPEYILYDADLPADNSLPVECQEQEQSIESEGEDPLREQSTEDQEEEPPQREPYGTSRRSLRERSPAHSLDNPHSKHSLN